MDKVEVIIFDWAGTTVDFGCLAPVQAFLQAFQAAGVTVSEEEVRGPMGLPKREHIRALLAVPRIQQAWLIARGSQAGEADVQELYQAFEPALLQTLHNFAAPLPMVVETVAQLRQQGIKIGSTTGYTARMMEIILPIAAASGYAPDRTVTPDDTGGRGRPYPDMVFQNMMTLGAASVSRVIKVGDTRADMAEGRNAGVWTVGVVIGSSELGLSPAQVRQLSAVDRAESLQGVRESFQQAGAHFVVDDISQLLALLPVINGLLAEGKRP